MTIFELIFKQVSFLQKFNQFADSLSESGFAVSHSFFSKTELSGFIEALKLAFVEDEFKQAGIGTGIQFQKNKKVRGDKIVWIKDNSFPDYLKPWRLFVSELTSHLNYEFFAGIRDHEFHFAFYPKGTFYEKHIDQFKGRNNRLFSCILYLNEFWKKGDGGELILYLENGAQEIIEPTFGKFVCFRSERFEHEVSLTQKNRFSITGWFLNYPRGLGFLGYQ